MNKEELIKKYLLAELSKDEEQQLLKHLDEDDGFANDLQLHSLLYAERARKIKSYLNEHKSADVSQRKIFKIIRNVAAVLLLGVCATFVMSRFISNKSDRTFIQVFYEKPFTNPGLEMSASSDFDTWNTAVVQYGKENYEEVEEILLGMDSISVEQQLYLALAKMYKNPPAYHESISILESINGHSENVHQDATLWYLSLSYLKVNKDGAAKSILEKIADSNHYRNKDAMLILKAL